jgi:hypothetical protein
MTHSSARVKIRVSGSAAEKERIADFITSEFRKCFGTTPPSSQILFGAYVRQGIVGAVALDFGDAERLLPFERIYDCSALPDLAGDRTRSAQFGKWRSTVPGVAGALIYAATLYALKQDKLQGWFVAKPKAAGRMQSLGILLRRRTRAKLSGANIPPGDRSYYLLPPQPQLYAMSLRQVETALSAAISPLLHDQRIIIDV